MKNLNLPYLFMSLITMFMLTACETTLTSNKASGYSKKLNSSVIWLSGNIVEQSSMMADRMGRVADELRKNLAQHKLRTELFVTKEIELDKEEKLKKFLNDTQSDHYFQIKVLRIMRNGTSIAQADFYDFQLTLIDVKTSLAVWTSTVQANFYSQPDDMAKKLVAQLISDGLVE